MLIIPEYIGEIRKINWKKQGETPVALNSSLLD
jgi:hypothetical protein